MIADFSFCDRHFIYFIGDLSNVSGRYARIGGSLSFNRFLFFHHLPRMERTTLFAPHLLDCHVPVDGRRNRQPVLLFLQPDQRDYQLGFCLLGLEIIPASYRIAATFGPECSENVSFQAY
jgi:hypothetical protein